MAVNPKKLRPYDQPPRSRRSLVPNGVDSGAASFLVLSLIWLVAATGIGLLWAGMLLFPDVLRFSMTVEGLPIIGDLEIAFNARTVGAAFVDTLVYGWITNAAFAAILFITPRVLGVRLAGDGLAFLGMVVYNLGVAGGLGLMYLPQFTPNGRYAEYPFLIDGAILLGFLVVNAVFWRTVLASRRRLPYVSVWFFGVALLATMGMVALGALPGLLALVLDVDPTLDALITAFAARAIDTFWLLGVALGTLLYIVPRVTGNPLYSGGMGFLAWLLWAGLAAISALGALVDPSVPFVITSLGNVGTILLVAPVFLVVANAALSLSGRWSLVVSAGPIQFAVVAMAFLLGAALLESIGALRSVQALVRGTQWGTGVWLLTALGSATLALYAAIEHAAPRVLRRSWGGTLLSDAQLWLTFTGTTMAVAGFVLGGIAHGSLLREAASAEEISAALLYFHGVAAAGLGLVALGGLAAILTVFLIYTTARRADYAIGDAVAAAGQ